MAWAILRNGPVLNSDQISSVEVKDVTLFFRLVDGSEVPDVYATNADALAALAAFEALFTTSIIGNPTVLAVWPPNPAANDASVFGAVGGTGFKNGGSLKVNNVALTVEFVNSTTYFIKYNSTAAGTYDLVYVGPNGETGRLVNGVTFA